MTVTVIPEILLGAKETSCSYCGAMLRYYPEDVRTDSFEEWIECPLCRDAVMLVEKAKEPFRDQFKPAKRQPKKAPISKTALADPQDLPEWLRKHALTGKR